MFNRFKIGAGAVLASSMFAGDLAAQCKKPHAPLLPRKPVPQKVEEDDPKVLTLPPIEVPGFPSRQEGKARIRLLPPPENGTSPNPKPAPKKITTPSPAKTVYVPAPIKLDDGKVVSPTEARKILNLESEEFKAATEKAWARNEISDDDYEMIASFYIGSPLAPGSSSLSKARNLLHNMLLVNGYEREFGEMAVINERRRIIHAKAEEATASIDRLRNISSSMLENKMLDENGHFDQYHYITQLAQRQSELIDTLAKAGVFSTPAHTSLKNGQASAAKNYASEFRNLGLARDELLNNFRSSLLWKPLIRAFDDNSTKATAQKALIDAMKLARAYNDLHELMLEKGKGITRGWIYTHRLTQMVELAARTQAKAAAQLFDDHFFRDGDIRNLDGFYEVESAASGEFQELEATMDELRVKLRSDARLDFSQIRGLVRQAFRLGIINYDEKIDTINQFREAKKSQSLTKHLLQSFLKQLGAVKRSMFRFRSDEPGRPNLRLSPHALISSTDS